MASRRKSTTPCMRPPQEVVEEEDSDQEMEFGEEAAVVVGGGEEHEEEEEEEAVVEAELGGEVLLEPYLDSGSAEAGGYECKYCSFRTSEVKRFTLHVDQEHPHVVLNASYVCLACDFHTKRYDALLEHNSRQHPGGEGFTRTLLRRHNHTLVQQSVKTEEEGPGEEPGEGACRSGIALSKTPIMRARRRDGPKKFPPAPRPAAEDIIKLERRRRRRMRMRWRRRRRRRRKSERNMGSPRVSPRPAPSSPPAPRLLDLGHAPPA
ncbi:hypothetical protein CRUP_032031 [Coryphaenoides rupestris]|nr:hypothetical protein CRUP_032031 [Coryphaenoides rupestris]